MNFNVMESNVRIVGEEMLGIVRDSTGETLADACNELAIEINDGSGSVSVTDGSVSGAISTTDSLEEDLSAEKKSVWNSALTLKERLGGTRKRPNVGTWFGCCQIMSSASTQPVGSN